MVQSQDGKQDNSENRNVQKRKAKQILKIISIKLSVKWYRGALGYL